MPRGKVKAKPAAKAKAAIKPVKDEPALDSWKGEDGTKSPGFALHAPKPGLATDADDAGRGGEDLA